MQVDREPSKHGSQDILLSSLFFRLYYIPQPAQLNLHWKINSYTQSSLFKIFKAVSRNPTKRTQFWHLYLNSHSFSLHLKFMTTYEGLESREKFCFQTAVQYITCLTADAPPCRTVDLSDFLEQDRLTRRCLFRWLQVNKARRIFHWKKPKPGNLEERAGCPERKKNIMENLSWTQQMFCKLNYDKSKSTYGLHVYSPR